MKTTSQFPSLILFLLSFIIIHIPSITSQPPPVIAPGAGLEFSRFLLEDDVPPNFILPEGSVTTLVDALGRSYIFGLAEISDTAFVPEDEQGDDFVEFDFRNPISEVNSGVDAWVAVLDLGDNNPEFSSFFGGEGFDQINRLWPVPGRDIIVVAGSTTSATQFPGSNPVSNIGGDNFISVINFEENPPEVRSTIFGGDGLDSVSILECRLSNGLIEILTAGFTDSTNFATNLGPCVICNNANASTTDAWFARHNIPLESGDFVPIFHDFFGGVGPEVLLDARMSPDDPNEIFLAGNTNSPDLVTNAINMAPVSFVPYQATPSETFVREVVERRDGFYASFNQNGPITASFIGGTDFDSNRAIFLSDDFVHIIGATHSPDFAQAGAPNLPEGLLGGLNITFFQDTYIMSFHRGNFTTAPTVGMFSVVGSPDYDVFGFVDFILDQFFVFTGHTSSRNFPQVSNFQDLYFGAEDCFLLVVDIEGNQVNSASYHGGSAFDRCHSFALGEGYNINDINRNFYLSGVTFSQIDFPLDINAPNPERNDDQASLFLTRIGINLPSPPEEDDPLGLILGLIFGICCLLFIITAIILGIFYLKKKSIDQDDIDLIETNRFRDLDQIAKVDLIEKIGEGKFGEVWKGKWKGTTVAVKKLKKGINDPEAFSNFQNEAVILNSLDHPNIVRILGVYRPSFREPSLVLEYLPLGNLKQFLVSRADDRDIALLEMVEISFNILSALSYCHGQEILHKDVSARNVLLVRGGSGYEAKLSDFGLSRLEKVHISQPSSGSGSETSSLSASPIRVNEDTDIPVRWSAPEILRDQPYTVKSEVYSFGVLVWEIFSYGENPFGWMNNEEVVQAVCEGEQLPQPKDCPSDIFELLLACWSPNPLKRPSMSNLLMILGKVRKQTDQAQQKKTSFAIHNEREDYENWDHLSSDPSVSVKKPSDPHFNLYSTTGPENTNHSLGASALRTTRSVERLSDYQNLPLEKKPANNYNNYNTGEYENRSVLSDDAEGNLSLRRSTNMLRQSQKSSASTTDSISSSKEKKN